jgi:hypothetical protein
MNEDYDGKRRVWAGGGLSSNSTNQHKSEDWGYLSSYRSTQQRILRTQSCCNGIYKKRSFQLGTKRFEKKLTLPAKSIIHASITIQVHYNPIGKCVNHFENVKIRDNGKVYLLMRMR